MVGVSTGLILECPKSKILFVRPFALFDFENVVVLLSIDVQHLQIMQKTNTLIVLTMFTNVC
jgi:hypothetical protein